MSVGFLSEVFLQPRVTLGWLDAPLGSTPSTSKEIPWRVFCRLPEGGDATHRETVQKLYGKCVAGQLYITDTQERVAAAVFNKTCAVGLDSARPGRRHLSYALGASLLDMILSRKEMLHGGHLIVDLTDVLFDDWVSYVDEFALAILVRSARPLLAKKKAGTDWERLHIDFVAAPEAHGADLRKEAFAAALVQAQILAEAMLWTRSLINAPPNVLRPDGFERVVTEIVKLRNSDAVGSGPEIRMEVFRGAALAEMNCRLICAVGQGSSVEPRLIKLTLRQTKAQEIGAAATRARVALVGKGITFDSGGYDIKPSAAMRNMKKDMGGAAAALGSFLAVAGLGLAVDLDLYLSVAENMVSGDAFRPGDVLVARDGSLVEIENTDAEGRLVLADALHFAAETQPDWILDFATLTGAARVALGPDVDALFSNEAEKALLMVSSGIETGDWVWQLPRVGSYQRMLDSTIGDLSNASTSGHAGALTAALFLERFVGRVPWTHIDTFMWSERPGSLTAIEPGATAKCIRLATEALRRFCDGRS
jgi:leucyl aminopeptidase